MEEAAGKAGLNWGAVHACGTSSAGTALMVASHQATKDAGITYGIPGIPVVSVAGKLVHTKQPEPLFCGPTPEEVRQAVCQALAAKNFSQPAACE